MNFVSNFLQHKAVKYILIPGILGFSLWFAIASDADETETKYRKKSKEVVKRILEDSDDEEIAEETKEYVGIKNEGATCYLNSLLQALFHIPIFRKCVFQMTTFDGIPFELQKLFHHLQFHDSSAASASDLIASFGWTQQDAFIQHDVQELARVFMEKLEPHIKNFAIRRLFQGITVNYIKCINVDYESSTLDAFFDIQLNVSGCQNIYDAFDKYIECEILRGENQYDAGKYGLQDAKKGCLIKHLPPILMLHLKRFQFDYMTGGMRKVNDRFEFYDEIDLNDYVIDQTQDCNYTLLSVLVHAGTSVHSGHYYAYINVAPPKKENYKKRWCKFDDATVSYVTEKQAIENNFGGPFSVASAYMLIYAKKSELETILKPVEEEDIPKILKEKLESTSCVIS